MGTGLCKPCVKNRKTLHQTSSILDRVISQASNQDQCLLYRLANYKKGGELIDAYNLGGQAEVEKLIKEQFGILMYADGKGQMINRAEYLRWKFRDQEQVVLPIEASLSAHDPLAKWSDHEACWQMQYRGSLGESLLHLLIICDTKIHTRLARTLLKCFPKLALDVVEGEEYLGASALHLSIAYNNNELVQDLVEAGANVNQRAIGSFFLPRDQQKSKPAKTTDYEGLAYLGEYPLAWAACCANESVYNLLLDSGAHPDLQDNFGNMILHMVVVCDKLDMFGYALRHPKLPASNGIANKAGLTPLTLACKLGRAEVFKEMLELSAKEFWRYSNITCSAYPLNALDTLLPDGRTNWNSALFIILNGTKEEHLDMLDGGIIQRLLEEKWKTFARNQFLKRLLILLIHLLCLSLAVYLRPDDSDESLLRPSDDLTVMARYACEIGTLLGVLSYVVFQQGDEIKNQGLLTFLKQQTHAPAKAIFLVSNLLILACIPCRLAGDKNTEEAILVFAVPGSWFLLMFFAGAVRLTGPFVTMIYSMITGDMLTFGYPGVKNTLYNSYPSTWMALFQITLGDYSYSDLSNTTYPSLSKTVFAIFMVFVPILLLNMLIAMMGNTYAHVIEQSEKEWMKQWAKIVVTLERAVPQSDAHHYLQEYSIKLGPGDEPGTEQRGVMVIKSKSKTRAKQRKGAVSNWKRVGKITITELRKRGMTGEQLRNIMWGRASISTPVKVKSQIVDPLQDMEGNNLGGYFGGALTAALDVMAFTHDLDLALPNGSKVVKNTTDADYTQSTLPGQFNVTNMNITNTLISQTKATTAKIIDTGINACGSVNQVTNSNLTNQSNLNSKTQLEVYVDPLRELILLSDKNSPDEIIKMFAFKSANIENFEEVKLKEENASQLQNCINDVFSLKQINSKMKIEEQKKRLSVFELSDSDGFGEVPLLGRVSRQRRARSANFRNRSAKSNKSDNTLILRDLSPSETSTSDNNTSAIADDFEGLNFAEERIRQVKESLKNECQGQDFKSLRPSNIDQAFGICNDDEVVSEQVLIKGLGNGLEIESGNIQLKFDGAKSNKSNQRSKTARSNRIAPTEKCQERRGKSAIINSTVSATQDPFPDPLEPWSIKNIVSMNTILAWEDDTDSM